MIGNYIKKRVLKRLQKTQYPKSCSSKILVRVKLWTDGVNETEQVFELPERRFTCSHTTPALFFRLNHFRQN